MRILFVLGIDMKTSGPSVHLLNDIIKAAKLKGHDIVRIEKKYGNDTWIVTEESSDKEHTYTVECSRPQGQSYVKRYIDDLKYVYKCWKTLKNQKVDVIFLQSCNNAAFQCFWLKHYLKAPIVYNVQDIFPLDIFFEGIMSKRNPAYIIFDQLQKYAYRLSSKIITISKDMEETLINLGVKKDKLSIVYNWAYEDDYNEEFKDTVVKQFFSDDYYHVVYAGNIGVAQNVEILIKACKILTKDQDIIVTIIGNGSRVNECKNLAAALKVDNIRFYDLVPQHLARYIYEEADVNIVTLLRGIIHTSMPSKTAACYKSNKPVIYCADKDSKTVRALAKSSNMFYQCDPNDFRALADLIMHIKDKDNKICVREQYDKILTPQKANAYIKIMEEI